MSRGEHPISAAEAERLVAAHWAFDGSAIPIPAEVDQNFRIATPSGSYLLKVVPADEDESLTEIVTAALMHLDGNEDVAVQRVVATSSGAPIAAFRDADGLARRARLTTFLEGRTLRSLKPDTALRRHLGEALARLAIALRNFKHPGADRDLSWDLRHADRMRVMLTELPPSVRTDALAECLDRFAWHTVPRLVSLPTQIVHNDLSRDNAIVTPDGRLGALDFGDIVRTQRINDLAIAMADHLYGDELPFSPALDIAEGYLEVVSLDPAELALLYELVRTRVATRIVGGEWRASRFPENRSYLARNVESQWSVFVRLPEVPPAAAAERIAAMAIGCER